jgi:FAD/FMN-containing dehydrogenase
VSNPCQSHFCNLGATSPKFLNSVQVLDPATGLVRIGAGATWGEVSAVLQRHGLALTSGDTVSVGAGGRGGAMFVRSLGGAMTRVPRDATAFAHRDAEAMVVAATFLAPDASDADVDTALQPWRPIAELGSGAYANFLGTATDSDIADIYPPATYERLARVKRAYDPTNLFSRNHNISPAG